MLDGPGFAAALYAGTYSVVQGREHLDLINVFPVADADTGANMAATLQAASDRLRHGPPTGIGDAVRQAADGALDGARGNSGAILAQFFHGLAQAFDDRSRVSAHEFALGAVSGSQAAWGALQSPREGTILSVLRSWSEALSAHSESQHDLAEALGNALQTARHALAETPHQLAVLARRKVVDAGAQGFVYFLEGMWQSMRTGASPVVLPPATRAPRAIFAEAHREVDASYRFCAEALVSGADLDPEALKARIAPLGESLVIAGGGTRVRIHIHTNAPQRFTDEAARFGVLEATKVDDMILQQLAARRSTIALVTDSTCDLPDEIAYRLGVVRVPLKLTIDDNEYRDGVDMTAAEYYRRLPLARRLPTSSQPSVSEFVDVYSRLLEHHESVVSLHLSGLLSGTVDVARSAAATVDPQRIRVIDTHKVSVGLALLVESAARAIEQGSGIDEVERRVLAARDSVALYGAVSSLEQAVKGGRVSRRGARALQLAHLYPIIVFSTDGRALKGGVALGFESALRQLVRRAVAFAAGGPVNAMVVQTDRVEAAEAVAAALRDRLGLDAVPVVSGGPVIATHVGLGCVTVAIERLDTSLPAGQPGG